jgi:hypothetical protein
MGLSDDQKDIFIFIERFWFEVNHDFANLYLIECHYVKFNIAIYCEQKGK